MTIDLHTHSTASDGTDRPAELVAKAAAANLSVVAITDHDTTAGWDEALGALPPGLTLVTGAEFSCAYDEPDGTRISLHLLGYLFDPDHDGLRAERARLRVSRLGRGRAIVDNMIADGVPVTWNRVVEIARGGAVGRPHIARVLVENSVVASVDEAFAALLSSRSKYYVPKADSDVFKAIGLVRDAGGIAVFAHPLARRRGAVVGEDVIADMAQAGLQGIEVDHPDHAPDDRARLAVLAGELGLIGTGSSDYHGTNKKIDLGTCTTSRAAYEQLRSLETARQPVTR
ncbi:MAG TPA: PHP domain-containing protein [Jatrophihabitantaceae bacterium]|nr:PHP domain-containing protein [Jatrophihabitantaceae bacterium]